MANEKGHWAGWDASIGATVPNTGKEPNCQRPDSNSLRHDASFTRDMIEAQNACRSAAGWAGVAKARARAVRGATAGLGLSAGREHLLRAASLGPGSAKWGGK